MQLIFLGLSICLHSEILWYYSNKSFLDADTLSCRWGLEVRHVRSNQDLSRYNWDLWRKKKKKKHRLSVLFSSQDFFAGMFANAWLASSLPLYPFHILHTVTSPSQPLTFFFPLVLDVFWDEQSLGRGRSQTYDLSEDGTKRRRLEAWAWLVGLDNQSYIQIGRLCSIWPFPDAAPPVKHEIRNSVLVLNTIFPPIASNSWKCTYILVLTSYLLNVYDKPLRHQWYFKVF